MSGRASSEKNRKSKSGGGVGTKNQTLKENHQTVADNSTNEQEHDETKESTVAAVAVAVADDGSTRTNRQVKNKKKTVDSDYNSSESIGCLAQSIVLCFTRGSCYTLL